MLTHTCKNAYTKFTHLYASKGIFKVGIFLSLVIPAVQATIVIHEAHVN